MCIQANSYHQVVMQNIMVLFQLLPYVFQPVVIIKGGKTPIFSPPDALGFWL